MPPFLQAQIAEVALAYHADWPQMDTIACYELGHDAWHLGLTETKADFSVWDTVLLANVRAQRLWCGC